MRKLFSVSVVLITLMLCVTLFASDVSAAPVSTVGGAPCPPPANTPPINAVLSALAGTVAHFVNGSPQVLITFLQFLAQYTGQTFWVFAFGRPTPIG